MNLPFAGVTRCVTCLVALALCAGMTACSEESVSSPTPVLPAPSPAPAAVTLSTVLVNSPVVGGQTAVGTVMLSGAAPTGGFAVSLTVNNAAATVPSPVTVPAGTSSLAFTITTTRVTSAVDVTITARAGEDARTASIRLQAPPASLSGVQVDPSFIGGQTTTGTVTLTSAAPEGGVTVTLNADNAAVTVPPSVTVPAGAATERFTVTSRRVTNTTAVTITARAGEETRTASITLRAEGASTVTFSGLGGNGSTVSTYGENGYTIDVSSANWFAAAYGRPGPSLQFNAAAGTTAMGEARITAGGAPFSLLAIDLYSSVTRIPYVFEGFRNSQRVFQVSETQGNTFGNFVTVTNPRADDVIDLLIVRLTNQNPVVCCGANPMGMDNIVLRR